MECLTDEEVAGWASGDLDDATAARAEAHLDRCDPCRMLVAEALRLASFDEEPREPSHDTTAEETLVRGGPARPLEPGAEVGRYHVTELLAGGGMGLVYAARDPALDRRVALKVVRPDLSAASAARLAGRLLREAKAMARVSHPNVVPIYDVVEHDDRVFIAMDLIDGGTLRDVLAAPPGASEILRLFIEAGRGLAAAHAAGLVHRDFKPSNVMVGSDGRARVTDFGLALLDPSGASEPDGPDLAGDRELRTRTGTLLGTPAYMAPEQRARGATDARTDQFSFCVALHEALFGVRPFEADTPPQRRTLSGEGAAPGVAGLGAETAARVRAAIERGLALAPDDRFPSMDALLAELSPIDATSTRVHLLLGRARRTARLAVAVGALGVAGAIALLAIVIAARDGGRAPTPSAPTATPTAATAPGRAAAPSPAPSPAPKTAPRSAPAPKTAPATSRAAKPPAAAPSSSRRPTVRRDRRDRDRPRAAAPATAPTAPTVTAPPAATEQRFGDDFRDPGARLGEP